MNLTKHRLITTAALYDGLAGPHEPYQTSWTSDYYIALTDHGRRRRRRWNAPMNLTKHR